MICRIRKLQEQLILTNENRVFYSQKQIQDFLNGKADFVMENQFELLNMDTENQQDKLDHCSSQELKRIKVMFSYFFISYMEIKTFKYYLLLFFLEKT